MMIIIKVSHSKCPDSGSARDSKKLLPILKPDEVTLLASFILQMMQWTPREVK